MSRVSEIDKWFRDVAAAAADRDQAIHDAYQHLENTDLVSKVAVHRYLCQRNGCVLATVIRVGDCVIARTRDNKLSPGANLDRTVESARIKNTLDGDRHWPGHTFDVGSLAEWGPVAGMDASCRHGLRTILAVDVLAAVDGVQAGHPKAPTLL